MDQNENTPAPANRWVGDMIGYSPSGASLLRRGLRSPTLHTMRATEIAIGWPVHEQVHATETPLGWSHQFEEKMRAAYAREIATKENEEA